MEKASLRDPARLASRLKAALGTQLCDYVIKNVAFLDVHQGRWVQGDVAIFDGMIVGTVESYEARVEIDGSGAFLVPGFLDTHVHIESSMLTPRRFEEMVLPLGTTTAIWDPHEIANVKGLAGIRWALAESEKLAMDIYVMIPSCVPATSPELGFETSGAELYAKDILPFRDHPKVLGLAEMMNYPGVFGADDDVLEKLSGFSEMRRDGHCPGVSGKHLNAYGVAGIHSCHESTTLEEAREKMTKGLHVLIREGSCAKDAAVLLDLLDPFTSANLGLCSDDRNPLDIQEEGHIGFIIEMALKKGIAAEVVFRSASYGAAQSFGLGDRGVIAPGYLADLCLVKPKTGEGFSSGFDLLSVFKRGEKIEATGWRELSEKKHASSSSETLLQSSKDGKYPNLRLAPIQIQDLRVELAGLDPSSQGQEVRVIGVRAGQILTDHLHAKLRVEKGALLADLEQDILKIAVFERHRGSGHRNVGFVKGFNLQKGAIATSINHDSHNIIVVGSSDELMVEAVNFLLEQDGGIVVVSPQSKEALRLPIAGLMTDERPEHVASRLHLLKRLASDCGCTLKEPFLQLSFLALPVIPELKITDRALIDVVKFAPVSLAWS